MTTGGDSFLESILPKPAPTPTFLTDLSGKIALVTGGSRGIGRAVAIRLAQAGAKISFNYRGNHEAAQDTLSELKGGGAHAMAVAGDVSLAADVDRLVGATIEAFGRIDILVNNAGDARFGRGVDTTDEQWAQALDVNLYSAVRFTRAVVPHMRAAGGGRIINISTVGAHSPFVGMVDYEAAMDGLLAFA